MGVFSSEAFNKALSERNNEEKKYRVLVVDDEETNTFNLRDCLQERHHVLTALDGREALKLVREQAAKQADSIQVIIADQRMPRLTGVELLEQTLTLLPRARRLILTGYSDIDVVINAINRAQVYRFLMKPWTPEGILETVAQALVDYEAERAATVCFDDIVGSHPKLLACLETVRQVAGTNATVLIRGETGTGKELIARALYQHSSRCRRPFATIHCSALPESLLEAELFGHKKGAFTGAHADRAGRIAQANGGTLFIDEVGELPPQTQAKLLRFFQFGEIQRVGSDRVEKVDVRVVAATHRNLEDMIEQGGFREDLYYRLKVVEIELPPLRERRADIPLLAKCFLEKYWQGEGEPVLLRETLMILEDYAYPGNVRELAHLVERACLLARTSELTPNLLPAEVLESFGRSGERHAAFPALTNEVLKEARQRACKQASDEVERLFLERLLDRHEDVAAASRCSGIQRTYLHKLLTKHSLR